MGGAADREFIFDALQDEVGLIPGFSFQAGDVIQVDDMGAIDSGEGWKGFGGHVEGRPRGAPTRVGVGTQIAHAKVAKVAKEDWLLGIGSKGDGC